MHLTDSEQNQRPTLVNMINMFYVSHTVHYKTINWRKSNQQIHCNFVSFIKTYLFIAPTCFGYFLAIIRVLVIWYSGRTMCIFSKIQLFTLVPFGLNITFVKIMNEILKMFCCLPLLCTVVCASHDGWFS